MQRCQNSDVEITHFPDLNATRQIVRVQICYWGYRDVLFNKILKAVAHFINQCVLM